jgi:serine/threonine-protein kinase
VGERFGHYVLDAPIGAGGMGEVWRARDTRLHDRPVALKLLRREITPGTAEFERFEREARTVARLSGPHLVHVHSYGQIDGRLYIDMQLIEGRDLATALREDGPFPPVRAAAIVAQVCDALATAHAAGLVHRDVKPSNILLTANDHAYLADFGIARRSGLGDSTVEATLTAAGSAVGTMSYMAPEQFTGTRSVDGRADVYALTCVLHEMLTGAKPFPVDHMFALLNAHANAPRPRPTERRPDLSRRWDEVVAQGMAVAVEARFPGPDALREAVLAASADRLAQTLTMPAQPPAPVGRPAEPRPPAAATAPRRERRPMTGVLVGLVLVLAAIAGGLLVWWNGTREQPVRPPPVAEGDLGLSVPVSSPPCDGGYVLFVGAAITPATYATEVQRHLDAYPGASYLYGPGSCPSTTHYRDGNPVYSVYFGPFGTVEQACTARPAGASDAFVRKLDEEPPSSFLRC